MMQCDNNRQIQKLKKLIAFLKGYSHILILINNTLGEITILPKII